MKNEGLIKALQVIGVATIGVGVLASFVLMVQFSQPGMFSKGELTGGEFLIAVGVAFYHVVLGILCFGVGQSLDAATRAAKMAAREEETKLGDRGPGTTKCPKCGQTYTGDLEGQYCEACGEKL